MILESTEGGIMKTHRSATHFGLCILALTAGALVGPRCPAASVEPGTLVVVAGNGTWDFSGDGGPAWLAALNVPYGVAADADGNLFIADGGNRRIRKVGPDGAITSIAGSTAPGIVGLSFFGDDGPAIDAGMGLAASPLLDPLGNLYFSEVDNQHVRKIDPTGIITSVAGSALASPRDNMGALTHS